VGWRVAPRPPVPPRVPKVDNDLAIARMASNLAAAGEIMACGGGGGVALVERAGSPVEDAIAEEDGESNGSGVDVSDQRNLNTALFEVLLVDALGTVSLMIHSSSPCV